MAVLELAWQLAGAAAGCGLETDTALPACAFPGGVLARTCTCAQTYMHILLHTHIYMCIYAYIFICIHALLCIHTYVYMHIFSYRGAAHREVRRSSKFDDFCPAAPRGSTPTERGAAVAPAPRTSNNRAAVGGRCHGRALPWALPWFWRRHEREEDVGGVVVPHGDAPQFFSK